MDYKIAGIQKLFVHFRLNILSTVFLLCFISAQEYEDIEWESGVLRLASYQT